MPIPKPKKGEKQDEFVSRCMGAIGGEYDDEKQAVAICYSTWRDRNKKPKGNEMHPLVANLDLTDVREDTWKGKQYKVAPVVMAKEGVMNQLLYPADELSKYVGAWNHRPLTLFHPMADGDYISANDSTVSEEVHMGLIRNAKYEDGLRGEAWLDIEHAQKTRPEVLEYFNGAKQGLEVSTGLWGDVLAVSGDWQGEKYDGIMTNIRPDHLALLPGGEGACNWQQGCGLRANEEVDEPSGCDGTPMMKVVAYMARRYMANITDRELRDALQKALNALDSRTQSHYLDEIDLSKKQIIYDQYTRSIGAGGEALTAESTKLYRRGYTMENGEAILGDDVVEVRRVVSYQTVANTANRKGDNKVTKDEKIKALIADTRTRFEDGCEVFLNTLSDEQLDRLNPPDNVIVKPEETPPTNEPTKGNAGESPVQVPVVEPPKSATEWLAAQETMPKEIKDTMADALMLNAARKAELVESIVKDPRNTFTNDQLTGKSRQELEAIAGLIRPIEGMQVEPAPAQFYGMRLVPNTKPEDDKGPEPMVMPSLQEAFAKNLRK